MKKHSPAAYADVKQVMDYALKKPGLRYILSSYGRAVHFKQRCNTYRNMLRDMENEMLEKVPGARGETAYDILIIRQVNEEGESDRKGNTLLFEHHKTEGKLIDPDTGEEIEIHIPGLEPVIHDD